MKFRYYIRGFGAGLIVAAAVLLIAGMIEKNNNYIVSDNKETQSSGSVIAFTTESTDNKEKETQKDPLRKERAFCVSGAYCFSSRAT